MQNQEYINHWGISQSSCKDFQWKSPKKWKTVWIDKQIDIKKNEDSFLFGSILDTILFSPELYKERYYVGKEEKLPSKAIVAIVKDFYDKILAYNYSSEEKNKELPVDIVLLPLEITANNELLIDCANNYCYKDTDGEEKCGWNTNWKADTRIASIIKQGSSYFKSLIDANGRKIISQDMNVSALELKNILLTNEDTKDYFVNTTTKQY